MKYATVSKVFHAYRQRGKESEKGIRSKIYKQRRRDKQFYKYTDIEKKE